MSKELFVSSTPHETKLALVEDDEVAELYFQRDNEYSLAGSIYKGRVTRVLPGMQSAFVDVGLERDAFLYVTDFLEVPDEHGDIEEVAVTPSRALPLAPLPPRSSGAEGAAYAPEAREGEYGEDGAADRDQDRDQEEAAPSGAVSPADQEDGGRWRGRRRRRGRRGRVASEYRPESGQESPGEAAAAAPATPIAEAPEVAPPAYRSEPSRRAEAPAHAEASRRAEAARRPEPSRRPEPRYQPVLLPGESISKYANLAPPPAQPEAAQPQPEAPAAPQPEAAPQPFTWTGPAPEERPEPAPPATAASGFYSEPEPAPPQAFTYQPPPVSRIAAEAPTEAEPEPEPYSASRPEPPAADSFTFQPGAGAIEEEVIDEEEADLPTPAQELQHAFDELEEEVLENGDAPEGMIAAGRQVMEAVEDAAIQSSALAGYEDDLEEFEEEEALASAEAAAYDNGDDNGDDDDADHDADDGEEDDDEEGDSGDDEARAEVRGPAPTAAFQQRPERAARPQRRPERGRGGRRPGGRRMGRGREQHRPHATISELLKEGQEILVQIAKEPIGKKGARITSHIALPGRFLVYMPTVSHMGVSRKIASDEERQRLKRILLSERDGHGGFIVRTAAENADEGELRADIRFLKNLWHEIRTRADSGPSPALIYHDLNLVERILRDQVNHNFSRIWVDTEQEYERIVRFMSRFQPALVSRVKLYTKETPLFEEFGIQDEIDKALKSKVWLKSGGYIVINQTEALVAIDINTGKYVGKTARLEDTIVKTNVDAIKEIVRQVRLRDLGGIIVIDFIDMDERRNRQKVMQALEEALQSDRAPSKVLQFNDFGLVAITRKRVKQSLERTLGEPCNYCTGTGLVKSVTTICNEIFVEMRKLSKQLPQGDVLLRVHPEVAKALKATGARWLQEMEELTDRNIIVKSDPMLHQEKFDIN